VARSDILNALTERHAAKKEREMERSLRLAALLACVLPATPQVGKARGGDAAGPTWRPKATARYLDGRADWWLNWSGAARGQGTVCLSCHTTVPFALARPALGGQLGETAPAAAEKRLLASVMKRVGNWDKVVAGSTSGKDSFLPFYSKNMKPPSLGTEAVLNALVLVNHDARRAKGVLSAATRKALGHLWNQQEGNGAWPWLDFGLNPWEKDGVYYGASLAAVAVGMAGKNYRAGADVQAKVAALKKYLEARSRGQPLHHRAVGLWASSHWAGLLSEQERKKLIRELLDTQEADGGWGLSKLGKRASGRRGWKAHHVYPEGGDSDGYATGLVVLALKRAGVAADNPKLQKGMAWLATRQKEGSWPAAYLNKRRDRQSNVGKFMRDAATAFAVLALTEPGGSGPARVKRR
jgi:squalene-hopene/tetraprenyl-beta-curcumene cyclase